MPNPLHSVESSRLDVGGFESRPTCYDNPTPLGGVKFGIVINKVILINVMNSTETINQMLMGVSTPRERVMQINLSELERLVLHGHFRNDYYENY